MPVKGCRGSEVDDRHLNGGGCLNHQCYRDARTQLKTSLYDKPNGIIDIGESSISVTITNQFCNPKNTIPRLAAKRTWLTACPMLALKPNLMKSDGKHRSWKDSISCKILGKDDRCAWIFLVPCYATLQVTMLVGLSVCPYSYPCFNALKASYVGKHLYLFFVPSRFSARHIFM